MTSRFKFIDTPINGLKIVLRNPIEDNRGFFSRFYCLDTFKQLDIDSEPKQVNHSYSKIKGTVRGMHYQMPPFAESKYVSCIKGSVFDVAVDLRKNSPTYLHWYGEILSSSNNKSLFIPKGLAHGFQSLEDNSELLYIVTSNYDSESERALNPTDPKLRIKWPLDINVISDKDKNCAMILSDFEGVELYS